MALTLVNVYESKKEKKKITEGTQTDTLKHTLHRKNRHTVSVHLS